VLGVALVFLAPSAARLLWAQDAAPAPPPAPPSGTGRYQVVQHWPVASPSLHIYLLDTATGRMWMPVQTEDGAVSWDLMARNDQLRYTVPEGGPDEPGVEETLPVWSAVPGPLPWDITRYGGPWNPGKALAPWDAAKAVDTCIKQCLDWELEGTDLK